MATSPPKGALSVPCSLLEGQHASVHESGAVGKLRRVAVCCGDGALPFPPSSPPSDASHTRGLLSTRVSTATLTAH